MTADIIFASNKLGKIAPIQLQSMLDHYDYGRLISFQKTADGAMGQTMFIATSKGEYVLKGNPLYSGQLQEEQYFVTQLQEKTTVPLPTPYLIDPNENIFGWSYSLMPQLKGSHLHDTQLQLSDSYKVAEAIAHTLTQFHSWNEMRFGQLNPINFTITPFEPSYTEWLFQRIVHWLNDASRFSTITAEDIHWTEEKLVRSKDAFASLTTSTFVMGDFKTGNFLIDKPAEGWVISGVFDFTNAYFADPASDLIKMALYYFNHVQAPVAKRLLSTYFGDALNTGIQERLTVHLIHQLVLDWGSAKATKSVTWDETLSFSQWAEIYVDQLRQLCTSLMVSNEKL